ncbi:hypothetical protein Tco_0289645, partial [Tanacetum coccineum]
MAVIRCTGGTGRPKLECAYPPPPLPPQYIYPISRVSRLDLLRILHFVLLWLLFRIRSRNISWLGSARSEAASLVASSSAGCISSLWVSSQVTLGTQGTKSSGGGDYGSSGPSITFGSLNDDTVSPRYDSDTLSESWDILKTLDDADNYVPPPIQKNDMMLSVIEQMKSKVEKCNK